MRNKGFFWFLTILLTAVCLYQLSFTWVSNSVEKKAEKTAETKLAEITEAAKSNADTALIAGRNIYVGSAEGQENAKAALINEILKEKATEEVYPVFGNSFKEVKNRSLAFGLDLVGGMSVTMEISIPEFVKSFARNQRSAKFSAPYEAAVAEYKKNGGDFIEIFAAKNKELNKGEKLIDLLAHGEIEEIDETATNEDVIKFLNNRLTSSMDGVEQIMNRRINQFGVAQPNIQKDPENHRLYIELPGVQDEVTVAEKLQSTANLQFFEVASIGEAGGMINALFEASKTVGQTEEKDTTATESLDALSDDLSDLSSQEETGLAGKLLPRFGGQDPKEPVTFTVMAEDKQYVQTILNSDEVKSVLNEGIKLMWSSDLEQLNDKGDVAYSLYAVMIPSNGKAKVGGSDVASARSDFRDGKRVVLLDFTAEGKDKWGLMTSENVGERIAITMDNIVYSAPNVINPITNGVTEISGQFSPEEARDLVGLLNGGALPAPCVIKEQTKVGPTIGSENSKAGLISFAVALLLVFVYMIFYYGKAGIVADIALFANILFIFGSLASFGAVLTLAGIAGIVLTIGMAVDANVLIFERIREEEAAGKDKASAIETGFKKALSSIIDANVTTMLTAIVLKVFGTGPIESFATTLIIGIFTSMFAALVITRLIMTMMLQRGKSIEFDTKLTRGAFKNMNINFVGRRKMFYAISGILVVTGLVMLFTKGLQQSVEFTGGRTYTVKFENSVEGKLNKLEDALKKQFVEADGKEASIITKTKENSFTVDITTNFMSEVDTASADVYRKLELGMQDVKAEYGEGLVLASRSVSSTISEELRSSSRIAIILSLIIIFAYILLRFGRWQYSTGALVAMAHDVIVVLGLFALLQPIMPFNMEIDQAFIAAILTVIGYSINDTVVVFDRIREDLKLNPNKDQIEQINGSLNSTLSRTINTSMTTFIVLLIIFLFGGAAIKGFIFALMIGVIVGTYSSLCIATPILIDFTKKKK